MASVKNTAWLDRGLYPFSSHFFSVNGHQLHYIDEGQGEVLLFVHGTPSWSFDFRHQIKALSRTFRCVAPDHIGFGLSDKPDDYDYGTPQHGRVLESLIRHLDLRNITLIVHDFGGPIGFDYALRNPENIRRIVVLNSWLWNCTGEPGFESIKGVLKNPLLPLLYKYFNFSPRFLLPRSFADKKGLSPVIRRHYTGPFSKIRERKGTLAFARSLLHDQDWFGALWEKAGLLRHKPALFIWGMSDPFVTPANLDKFVSAFTDKRVVKLDNCGHFPQEERHAAVTAGLAAFLNVPQVETNV